MLCVCASGTRTIRFFCIKIYINFNTFSFCHFARKTERPERERGRRFYLFRSFSPAPLSHMYWSFTLVFIIIIMSLNNNMKRRRRRHRHHIAPVDPPFPLLPPPSTTRRPGSSQHSPNILQFRVTSLLEAATRHSSAIFFSLLRKYIVYEWGEVCSVGARCAQSLCRFVSVFSSECVVKWAANITMDFD